MTDLFSTLREWAHALVAIVGSLIGAAGGSATIATLFGAQIHNLQSLQGNGLWGTLAALASKLIDSVHNAYTTPKVPATVVVSSTTQPAPVEISPPPPPVVTPPAAVATPPTPLG